MLKVHQALAYYVNGILNLQNVDASTTSVTDFLLLNLSDSVTSSLSPPFPVLSCEKEHN
jgi:hypothetical protein